MFHILISVFTHARIKHLGALQVRLQKKMHAWDDLQSCDMTEGRVHKVCQKVTPCDMEELNIRYPRRFNKNHVRKAIHIKHTCAIIIALKFAYIWKGKFSEHA